MQNSGTCCLKKCFNRERSKGNFVRENLKKIASLMKMQVFVFTRNHHLKVVISGKYKNLNKIIKI